MSDHRDPIRNMFTDPHRYGAFGDVVIRMRVRGFRCHTDTIIDVRSPITAFCGLNGTGKSTLIQLAACAYNVPTQAESCYYIKDFLVVGTLDPAPFAPTASIEFRYWQRERNYRTVTLSRNDRTRRWRGYRRRPARRVFFAGIGIYLPRVEQHDFIIRQASRLQVVDSRAVAQEIRDWTCRVLGQHYDQISANIVDYSGKRGTVASVRRSGSEYSEAHMGYGEGRTQYLITALETLPDRSLVLIEEPETSLHPFAQHELGRYFVDVVERKRHQMFLTTHSEYILQALPAEGIIYLKKVHNGVELVVGLSALQAHSLMSEGHDKALYILVEDDCAQAILLEIIRRIDPDFLATIGVFAVGDSNSIETTMQSLQETGLPVAAVRDADRGSNPGRNLFSLPGNSQPPEQQLFASDIVVQYLNDTYGLNLRDFEVGLRTVDHHEWIERLSVRVRQGKAALLGEMARVYASHIPENDAYALVQSLKAAVR